MRSVSIMEREPLNEVRHVDIPNFSCGKRNQSNFRQMMFIVVIFADVD